MPQPRPKILTRVTIPTGGWTMKVYSDDGGGLPGTGLTFTMAAGDYYVAADNQSDDFLYEFMSKAYAALDASAIADYNNSDGEGKPILIIDSDHKVNIDVGGQLSMRFAWTEEDGASIGAVLGVDTSADDDYTGTTLVMDYCHSHGWYADEDGLLSEYAVEDVGEARVAQSLTPSGSIKTVHYNTLRRNRVGLQYLTRAKTFSGDIDYQAAPTDPYERNEPLQCWWNEAVEGVPFRVYEHNQLNFDLAEERGTESAADTTTLTDASKSWDVEPFEHKGKILAPLVWDAVSKVRWYIASHTATVLTVANSLHNTDIDVSSATYYIFDERYRTYILDQQSQSDFAPAEIPNIDRYNFSFSVRELVS